MIVTLLLFTGCKEEQQQLDTASISSIGDLIVAVEGRNGNSPASYKQTETLRRTFSLLENENIQTDRFRADAASYQKEVVDLVVGKDLLFYIWAKNCADMEQQIGEIPEDHWVKIRLDVQEMDVAEINYLPFFWKNLENEKRAS